jgi:hypothetical protein
MTLETLKQNAQKIDREMYLDFITYAIKTEGYKTADIANKMALEIEAITIDLYLEAAHLILDAYRAQ